MICKRVSPLLLSGLLAAAFVAPVALADEWDKKTVVTFSQSVEVPGKVLPAGKYVFKLLDSPSNRHIVRIMNDKDTRLITTVLAIPTYRMDPPDKPVFTFYEAPAGVPQALHEWLYPGDNYGQEFVYPKSRMTEIRAAITRGSSEATITATAMPVQTEVKTETQVTENSEVAAVTPTPAPLTDTTPTDAIPADNDQLKSPAEPEPDQEPVPPAVTPQEPTPAPSSEPTEMPKTASQIVLIGLLGGLAGLGAMSARKFQRNSR